MMQALDIGRVPSSELIADLDLIWSQTNAQRDVFWYYCRSV